jgi:tRNA G18 (ribose-2'-O)-methylase SpoU
MDMTPRKFLTLKPSLQHKIASEVLQKIALGDTSKISFYKEIESSLSLPPLIINLYEEVSARFYLHVQKANLPISEHSLLYVKKGDKVSLHPFLPVHIVLCSLRSAFNVGSIIRTMEAFRIGTLYPLGSTPLPSHPKVQKTSMGAYPLIQCIENVDLSSLPRPWVALETTTPSTSVYEFSFPSEFTLFLGNEEFGVPEEILLSCDYKLEIPLVGSKNSINVASAFAIVASLIRQSL